MERRARHCRKRDSHRLAGESGVEWTGSSITYEIDQNIKNDDLNMLAHLTIPIGVCMPHRSSKEP